MERAYEYWLLKTDGIGFRSYQRLCERKISARELFSMKREEVMSLAKDKILSEAVCQKLADSMEERNEETVFAEYEDMRRSQISFTVYGEKDYPKRLYCIPQPPLALYYKGTLPKEESLSVAVVGARDCTEYGAYVAKELGKELAKTNITLVSGMARGIDSISQQGAAGAGGNVYAVLGNGVDICYPRESKSLYERLCKGEGMGVLSEYAPRTEAKPTLFPPRNRIISGLSDVVVVVEARMKSGTFITVDMALEQGKEVYAVPGRITDRLSDGCNRLIKEGAVPFLSPADLVGEILEKKDSLMLHKRVDNYKKSPIMRKFEGTDKITRKIEQKEKLLTQEEKRVYEQIDCNPRSADEIMHRVGNVALDQLLCIIMSLQMKGMIGMRGNSYYRILS